MKKLFLTLILFFCLVGVAFANPNVETTFEWDAPTDADLAGYKLYRSDASVSTLDTDNDGIITLAELLAGTGVVIENIPAGIETVSILEHDGKWYYVLTAYDTAGNESGPSNEVSSDIDTAPPGAPGEFRKTTTIIININ